MAETIAQRTRARARWDFVRRTVWKHNLPPGLVEEAKWHKINIFAKEREIVRRAYSVYFWRPPCPVLTEAQAAELAGEERIIVGKDGEVIGVVGEDLTIKPSGRGLKTTESTIEEVLGKYYTLWQRVRRWLVRAFYQARNFVTGAPIPPPTPPERRKLTVKKKEPFFYA